MPTLVWLFLLIVATVFVGVAGLVLLIVGLVKKRRLLWGSGVAVMVLVVVTGGITIDWGFQRLYQSLIESRRSLHIASVDNESMRSWFRENADVKLPTDVVLLNGVSIVPVFPTSICFLKIEVPEDFDVFLEKHFGSEASWADVEEHFDLSALDEEEKAAVPFWNLSEIKQCSFFFKGHPELPDMTYIAYDKKKGIAYVVGDQRWEGPLGSL